MFEADTGAVGIVRSSLQHFGGASTIEMIPILDRAGMLETGTCRYDE
jgi:hypothetical protein